MFAAAIIVFRESLEAALIISVMAAATRGIPLRSRWIVGGVLAGVFGATLVGSSMEAISNLADGMGQEMFQAGILAIAVGMLAWHNIWMSVHGREMAQQISRTAQEINQGTRERSVIFLVVALAVLREGSETVLFLYSIATGSDGGLRTTVLGGLGGLGAGALVGGLLYVGLLRVPVRLFFSITGALVLLLAASMASQLASKLIQADVLPSLGAPLWDTSAMLSQSSALGTLLHGLVGYEAQPAGMQLVFYVAALAAIGGGMVWMTKREQRRGAKAAISAKPLRASTAPG
jgi:high-affinity iron transporter